MADAKRQEFLDILDSIGTSLDNANSDIQTDLAAARDDEKMTTDDEAGQIENIIAAWDTLYTEFNILYEAAQAYEARGES